MVNDLLLAFSLGIMSGFIPGPVLAAIFTEILQSNFIKSLRIIFIAMFIETIVALFSLLTIFSLHLSQNIFYYISIIGASILVWIAVSIWNTKSIDMDQKVYFGFWKITAMIFANGMLWIFWITVCIPKAISLGSYMPMGKYVFLILVEIGWLMSTALTAFIFSKFRPLLSSPKIIPIMFRIFAIIFIYFALDMSYKSLKFILN